jgi:hypothetical protein
MFNFFTRKKRVVLDTFTNNSAVYEFFKIDRAKSFTPQWWKTTPSTTTQQNKFGLEFKEPTIRRCDGILSLYQQGLVLPLWSDLIIETTSAGHFRYQYSANETLPIDLHDASPLGPAFNNYIRFKLHSPWLIEEKSGVNFYLSAPTWNTIDTISSFHILPGVLNFKDQCSTHVNGLILKQDQRLEFSCSQAMAHMIPLDNVDIDLRHHLISTKEFEQRVLKFSYQSSFLGKYKKTKKL